MSNAFPVSMDLTRLAFNMWVGRLYTVGTFTMMWYDAIITIGQEVEHIWKKKFSPFTVLWFMNRYLPLFGYIPVMISLHAQWSPEACHKFIRYPESLKIATSFAVGAIFIVRIYAIYSRNMMMVVLGGVCLAAELIVKLWALLDITVLDLPPGFIGCIPVGKSHHPRFVFTWVAELGFDTVMFITTSYRALRYNRLRRGTAMSLFYLILRDGALYFGVIFVANLVTVLMFLFAAEDIKALNATFSSAITNVLVWRLILNLRGAADRRTVIASGNHQLYVTDDEHYEMDHDRQFAKGVSDRERDLSVMRRTKI